MNPNNGKLLSDEDEGIPVTAKNMIYHSSKYSSHVTLPVLKSKLLQLPKVRDVFAEVITAYPDIDFHGILERKCTEF